MNISPYEKGNIFNKDPLRVRKLLMHKEEIRRLAAKIAEKGYTLVPLSVYFKGSLVTVSYTHLDVYKRQDYVPVYQFVQLKCVHECGDGGL